MPEQRNPYKGSPSRAWVRLRLAASDGSTHELEFVADTGNPFALILDSANMARLSQGRAADFQSNFGLLKGGWLQLVMPELGLDQMVAGYANDAVAVAVKSSSPDFEGLVGLPLSQLTEYGGNANEFWIRKAVANP